MNRALVVADPVPGREVVGKELGNAGFDVVYSESDSHALRLLETGRPDLIVTDHDKPRVDGLELVRCVRSVSSIPVVVLTAFGSISECEHAMRLGADRFLQFRRDLDRLGQIARDLVDPVHRRNAAVQGLTAEGARALRERELRERLQSLVVECRGNIAEVARRMNRDRSTVRYHLRRFGLLG